MRLEVISQNAAQIEADALVIGLFAEAKDCGKSGSKSKDKDKDKTEACGSKPVFTPSALEIESATSGALSQIFATGDFTGAVGDMVVLYAPQGVKARRVIVVGLGEVEAMTEHIFMTVHEKVARATRAQSIVLTSEEWMPEGRDALWAARSAVRALIFAGTPLDGFKTDGKNRRCVIESIGWVLNDEENKDAVAESLEQGRIIARNMLWAKNLADMPPGICTPTFLVGSAKTIVVDCERFCVARKESTKGKIELEWMDRDEMDTADMGGILGVAAGSDEEPRLIKLAWYGAADRDEPPVVIVGKGVTFDSGGLNLKPGRSMPEMKYDMCGAVAALALVRAACEMNLRINIVAIAPCAENLPSGKAIKPSDILRISNGMTVEVLNTDAEGRLLLADALTEARRYNPAVCIDLATLTGACVVALGPDVSGLFCNDDALTSQLAEAADAADDPVWPMPMGGRYRELLKSNVADLANTGNQPHSGACTAATFLSEFAPDCPWAHLDIAGPANTTGENRQSTSRPMPLMLEWLMAYSANKPAKKVKKSKK